MIFGVIMGLAHWVIQAKCTTFLVKNSELQSKNPSIDLLKIVCLQYLLLLLLVRSSG
jgi:hypothetical protein